MGKYLTKTGLTKYTTKLKEYISKAKVASATSADNATKVNGHTVNIDVPANAKFTDTIYKEATTTNAGLLGTEDKRYLDTLKPLVVPVNEEGNTSLNLITTDGLSIQHGVSGTSATVSVLIDDSQARIGMGNTSVNINGPGVDITASDNNDINITAGGDLYTTANTMNITSKSDMGIVLSTTSSEADIEFMTKIANEKSNITVVNKIGSTDLTDIGDGTITGAIKTAYERPVVGRVTVGAWSGQPIGNDITAEGINNIASGDISHAEGYNTIASGYVSHASGCGTRATRYYAYAEGLGGTASGVGAHVEGTYYIGYQGRGDSDFTDANITIKEIPSSDLAAVKTATKLTNPVFYMYYTDGSGAPSYVQDAIENATDKIHLFDNPLSQEEFYAFMPSNAKIATVTSLHSKPVIFFGTPNYNRTLINTLLNKNIKKIWIDYSFNHNKHYSTASGTAAHCEGGGNTASGHYSHAEGICTTASGFRSHAQGNSTTASGMTAFASGCSTTASGDGSYAGGNHSTASGHYSFATGIDTIASGYCSFSEGTNTIAEAECCHASGYQTKASNLCSHAMGHFNAAMVTGGNLNNKTGTALAIGNGSSNSAMSNAFSVQFSGITKAANTITASTTADYAEFFEWLDENPNVEDRVGYFVTLDGDKIKIAEADDDYILGVISGAPFVLGNGDCDVWNGMYLRDEFRRLKEEPAPKMIRVKNKETKKYENQVVEGEYEGTRFVLNPNYDSSQEYKSRFDRPEWAAVGMLGVLPVRHDGTARVNGYVTVGANGIATACEKTAANAYRVIKENSDSVVEIIFR